MRIIIFLNFLVLFISVVNANDVMQEEITVHINKNELSFNVPTHILQSVFQFVWVKIKKLGKQLTQFILNHQIGHHQDTLSQVKQNHVEV